MEMTPAELAAALGVNRRLIYAMESGIHTNRRPVSARAFERYRLSCAGASYEIAHGPFRWD